MCVGIRPGIEKALNMAVCHLGNDDSEVLPMRTGSGSVGASAVGREESVSNAALGHLAHRLHWRS